MKAPGYLFDSNVLANLFLERYPFFENAAHLWDLAVSGEIRGYVTQKALKDIYDLIEEHRSSKWALKAAKNIGRVMDFCLVESEMLREASAFNLENLSCALQLVCAKRHNLAGIVTPDPHSFRGVDLGSLEILTPGELSVRYLAGDNLSRQRARFERQLLEGSFAFDNQVFVVGNWFLGPIDIHCGNIHRPMATVMLKNEQGEQLSYTAGGNGPIDAAYKAINQLLVRILPILDHRLLDYCVKSVGEGEDAIGEATVILKTKNSGLLVKGYCCHTDTILASVYAYINALNTTYKCVEN